MRRINSKKLWLCLVPVALIACSTLAEKEHEDAASLYLQLGVRYLNINDFAAAKENLEIALKKDSDSVPAQIAMAFLFEKINRFDEARSHYEHAFKLDPENLSLQNNYGRFLCDRREFDKGMVLLASLTTNMLNDTPWMALTNAGRCQLSAGNKQQAEQYLGKALQANSTYAPALQEMQKLSYQNNDFKAAREYLQRYLAVAPQIPESLWIAVQTERALGNELQAKEYGNLLLEKFPFSNEAKQIKSTLR